MRRCELALSLSLCGACAAPPAPRPAKLPPPPTSDAPAASPVAVTAAARAVPSAPTPAALAARVRDPAWDAASEAELYELGSLVVLVADFETTAKRTDGMPVGFRRVALFDAEHQLLGQATLKMSEGGADLLEDERRDVDGDGAPDLILYYSAEDQWNPRTAGWLVATSRRKLVHGSLTLTLPAERRLVGSGCWASIDGVWVQIVLWQDSGLDRSGQPAVRGYRASATTIDASGAQPVSVFGITAEEGRDGEALDRRVPEPQRPPELDSPIRMLDCSRTPPTVVVTPSNKGWSMISGLSLRADTVGTAWPPALAKGAKSHLFEIPAVDPSTWQTNPDPK